MSVGRLINFTLPFHYKSLRRLDYKFDQLELNEPVVAEKLSRGQMSNTEFEEQRSFEQRVKRKARKFRLHTWQRV